jgi:hypothetical protein
MSDLQAIADALQSEYEIACSDVTVCESEMRTAIDRYNAADEKRRDVQGRYVTAKCAFLAAIKGTPVTV